MNKKVVLAFDPRDDEKYRHLSVGDCIVVLPRATNEDGILCLAAWPCDNVDNSNKYYECKMNWPKDENEYRDKIYKLLHSIEEIAKGNIDENSPEYKEVYEKYLKPFNDNNVFVKLFNILCNEEYNGELTEKELEFKKNYGDLDKDVIYSGYKDVVLAEAEKRIGKGFAAYDVIIRSMRVCKLIELGAPKIIIDNETKILAQAVAIHDYCESFKEKTLKEGQYDVKF